MCNSDYRDGNNDGKTTETNIDNEQHPKSIVESNSKVASGPDTHHLQGGPVTRLPQSAAATEQTISLYNLQKKTPQKNKPHYPPLSPEWQLVTSSKLQTAIRQKRREKLPPTQKQPEGFEKPDSFFESILKVFLSMSDSL
jgi:hypothetical protein